MNEDALISGIAPVSSAEAAALVSEHAAGELAEQIMRTDPRTRGSLARRPLRRHRFVLPAALTAAAAAAAVAIIATTQPSPQPGNAVQAPQTLAPAVTPAQLAANVTVIASTSTSPRPSQWVYVKVMSTISHSPPGGLMVQIPGTSQFRETWTQAGGQQQATFAQDGKLIVSSLLGSPQGWPRITYRYLNSLPTSPVALMRVIRHDLQTIPSGNGSSDAAPQVFDSVAALIENYPELPPGCPLPCTECWPSCPLSAWATPPTWPGRKC
jgi:hypothetical protein